MHHVHVVQCAQFSLHEMKSTKHTQLMYPSISQYLSVHASHTKQITKQPTARVKPLIFGKLPILLELALPEYCRPRCSPLQIAPATPLPPTALCLWIRCPPTYTDAGARECGMYMYFIGLGTEWIRRSIVSTLVFTT